MTVRSIIAIIKLKTGYTRMKGMMQKLKHLLKRLI